MPVRDPSYSPLKTKIARVLPQRDMVAESRRPIALPRSGRSHIVSRGEGRDSVAATGIAEGCMVPWADCRGSDDERQLSRRSEGASTLTRVSRGPAPSLRPSWVIFVGAASAWVATVASSAKNASH